jgi:hypothetical protein
MSGFLQRVRFPSSKHKLLIINGWNSKPDKITVDQRGWNVEPLQSQRSGRARRLNPGCNRSFRTVRAANIGRLTGTKPAIKGLEIVGPDGDADPLILKNLPSVCRRRRRKISWSDVDLDCGRKVLFKKNAGQIASPPGASHRIVNSLSARRPVINRR